MLGFIRNKFLLHLIKCIKLKLFGLEMCVSYVTVIIFVHKLSISMSSSIEVNRQLWRASKCSKYLPRASYTHPCFEGLMKASLCYCSF